MNANILGLLQTKAIFTEIACFAFIHKRRAGVLEYWSNARIKRMKWMRFETRTVQNTPSIIDRSLTNTPSLQESGFS
jgi:hypothetical protein